MGSDDKEKVIFTKESLDRLKKEYERLTTVERLKVASKLNEANDYGDLPENAAWLAATEESAFLELRIGRTKELLNNALVMDKLFSDPNVVDIGKTVTLEGEIDGFIQFSVVPISEIDVNTKKFGIESPMVKAVLGKTLGDEVKIDLGSKILKFKITKVC
jgi:transcription elongation factor GreA